MIFCLEDAVPSGLPACQVNLYLGQILAIDVTFNNLNLEFSFLLYKN